MALTPRSVYRYYEVDGVPSSGDHWPKKAEVIQLLEQMQGSANSPAVVRQTRSELEAVTPASETYGGMVLNDPNPANNGYYSRSGGAWVFGRGFPDTFARVALSGSGTAQTGVVQAGVNPASIEVFFAKVATANTGALTLSISGEAPKPVVNLAGNTLSAGEWTGMVMFYLNDANQYQMLIDAGAAAAAAASAGMASTDAVRAENAADAAEAALSSVIATSFATKAAAEAYTPVAAPTFIRIEGYYTAGDGGAALYKRVTSEPAHSGKLSIVLNDGITVVWYEIAEPNPLPQMFGVSGSGATTTAATTAGNPSITLADALDFRNGQGIALEHCGAASALATPTGLTVAATGLNRQGPVGSTTYAYRVAAVDNDGGVSAASAPVTINNGHATLGTVSSSIRGLAFNVVRWTTTAPGVAVWRSKSGGAYELLGVFGMGQRDSIADGVMDAGLPQVTMPWIPAMPPSVALNNRLVTRVVSGGGTTALALQDAPVVSGGAFYARHDDTAAVASYLSAVRMAEFPPGEYNINPITVPATVASFKGSGASAVFKGWSVLQSTIYATGMPDGFVLENINVLPVAWHNAIGIQLEETIGASIKNCRLSGNLPVFLNQCGRVLVQDNYISNWIDSAIFDYQGDSNFISNNVISAGCAAIPQNAAAIHILESNSTIVTGNKTYGNHVYSVKAEAGNQISIEDNYSYNSWCEAYHFAGSVSGSRIKGNTMFGGTLKMDYAISISNDDRPNADIYGNEICDNYIYQCGTAAIAVVEFGGANPSISFTMIKGNVIIAPNANQQPTMPGILIEGEHVSNTYIDSNTFIASGSIDFLVKESAAIYGMPNNTQVGTLFGQKGYSGAGLASLSGTGSTKLAGGGTGL
jgi:hypothetical protein